MIQLHFNIDERIENFKIRSWITKGIGIRRVVKVCLKFRQEKEEVHREGGVVTPVVRCSFHVFVAYRVYSPIRFAVSMGTRGKTYRFSLWTPLKEENSFKNPLAPSLTVSLILSLSGISFVSISFRSWPFPSFLYRRTFVPPEKKGEEGKKPEKIEETKWGGEERGNAPLKEVYFANKTGLVLCLLKQ